MKTSRTMIMKHIRVACLLLTLSLAVAALQAASTVIRTLVYHEISSLRQTPQQIVISGSAGSSETAPILSKNGNRAAFTIISAEDGVRHIFVINSDGTGQRELDSNNDFAPKLAINADGSNGIYTDHNLNRLVNAD